MHFFIVGSKVATQFRVLRQQMQSNLLVIIIIQNKWSLKCQLCPQDSIVHEAVLWKTQQFTDLQINNKIKTDNKIPEQQKHNKR